MLLYRVSSGAIASDQISDGRQGKDEAKIDKLHSATAFVPFGLKVTFYCIDNALGFFQNPNNSSDQIRLQTPNDGTKGNRNQNP